ncbi:nuclease-related domain-containing protein [Alteromonas sp. H39]|uniref:nuclease-related domain-containing protein n=1 Tax=Alteromonas sp. H39 TaxID=3389876 RepID=UPI0039DFC6C9
MALLFIIFLSLAPFAIFLMIITVMGKFLTRKSRIPFEYANMARIPAFSLLQQHREYTLDILAWALLATIYFQLPFSIPTIASLTGVEDSIGEWWTYSILLIFMAIYSLIRATRAFSKLRNTRLGIEAEWAVSQALATIVDKDVRIFHDIQGPNFNIDHVLTYPGGVLAIETKGRRKPNIRHSKDTHKLFVDSQKLVFPHFTDMDTIEQASRQANWLSKELTQSTGSDIKANPVVVIPGWFIEYKQKPTVPVMSHKTLAKYYKFSKSFVHDDSSLSRINYQLEQLAMRGSDEL